MFRYNLCRLNCDRLKRLFFISFCIVLSSNISINSLYGQCPDLATCMGGQVVPIDIDSDVSLCAVGGTSIGGDFTAGECVDANGLFCTAYVITRSPESLVTSIGGEIGQGNGCNGEMDDVFLQYNDPVTGELICNDILPMGGSQLDLGLLFPADLDADGNWIVTEIIIFMCANSNAFPTLCGACANDPNDCTGCDTGDEIVRSCDDGDPCTENDMITIDNCGLVCVPCAGTPIPGCGVVCDPAAPVVTVTDNTCDPVADGFYTVATACEAGFTQEFSTDGGTTWGTVIPAYPTPFITRCAEEICAVASLTGLDPTQDAVDEVNNGNVMIGSSTLTIVQTFNGTSGIDENEITDAQTGGVDLGISSGVIHACNENTCGLIANSMNNVYNFSEPICNFSIDIWDIDRTDEMVLTASGPNGPVTYTVPTIGAGVTQSGNTFTSNSPQFNYPGDGPPTLGMFTAVFDDCITQISIDYYDASDTEGNGGSYTIVFQDGCTSADCFSPEVVVTPNPTVCPVCEEDIVAAVTAPMNACSGAAVTFDASATTGITPTFAWDFGDGTTLTGGAIEMHTYAAPGIYTVNLTVTDPMGLCDPDMTSITIEICDTATFTCPGPITVVAGGSTDPAATGEPTIVSTNCSVASYTFSDVSVPGTCPIAEVITRTFTITDDCGTGTCTQTISVEGVPPVLNVAPPPLNACFGTAVTFDASASTGSGLQYCWDIDYDGITVNCDFTTAVVSHTYTTPGIYDVFVSITDDIGCETSQTFTIEVCDKAAVVCPPSAVTVISGSPIDTASLGAPIVTSSACAAATITFTDTSTPGTCPVEEIITRTFTVSDGCGTTICTQTITVEGIPPVVNVAPIPSEICLGTTIDLNASASSGSGLQYCWDIDYDGATVNCDYTTATASHTYTAGGTYNIYLVVTDAIGCEETFIHSIQVFDPPVKVATVTFDECALTITYDASGSIDNFGNDNLIFNWVFSDGSTSSFPSGVVTLNTCGDVGVVTLEIIDPDITNAACNSDGMSWTFTPDSTPPVVICPPVTDIPCGDPLPNYADEAAFIAAGGTASDNCGIVTFNIIATDTIPAPCPYSAAVEVTYEAVDFCGNTSTCTQMFNLIAPAPNAVMPPNLILSCGADIDTSATGSPDIVESFCALEATITFEDELISGSCPGDVTIIRSFTLTDQCGNQSGGEPFQQTINIVNDVPPLLQLPPDTIIECTSACDPSATGGIAQAIDFCMPIDGTVNEVIITWQDTIQGFDGTIYPGGVIGYIIRKFTAVDACGNMSMDEQKIGIRGGDSIITCNDRVNISIAEDCSGITPDFLLEDPGDTKYIIMLDDGQVGFATGATELFDWVDWTAYFETTEVIKYKIIDFCGNTCWGEIRIEANILPEYTSPCNYTPGNSMSESGELEAEEDFNLWDILGIDEYPERQADYLGTITLTNPACQDPILTGITNFIYTEDIPGKDGTVDVEYAELVLILINKTDGTAYSYNFPTGSIPATALVDLIDHPGVYDVYVSSDNWQSQGSYTININVNSCLPIAECSTICQGEKPGPYVTVEEILADFDSLCYAPIVGDIIVQSYSEGDMCEGLIHVETFYANVKRHGTIEKVEIISQAYFEFKLDLDSIDILPPKNVILDCKDPYTPEDIYEIKEDGTYAYPYYIDYNTIVPDSICGEEATIHVLESQDTVQELINFSGLWTLVDVVKKNFKDSIVCLRKIPNPEIQYLEILLTENVCNVNISYEDSDIEGCAGGKKIFREWSIIDWCESTSFVKIVQNIEITDTEAPEIEKYDDVTVSIDPWVCSATYRIPDLEATDNCNTDLLTQNWIIAEGRVVDGYILDLWLENSPVKTIIQIRDDCGNEVFDTINIIIEDKIPPVPVCADNLTVTLTSNMLNSDDGGAKIYASSFDKGSHDAGCGKVDIQVRRQEGCCLSECKNGYECTETDPKTGICIDSVAVDIYDDFGDFVKFCCEDVNSLVSVEILISDASGNVNYCWVEVFVDDKTQSNLICEDYEVECTEDIAGMPGAKPSGQVCTPGEDQIQLLLESGVDGNCGLDQIIREWYIDRDNSGDFSTGDAYCEQTITILQNEDNFDPYSIKWPKHYTGEVVPGINLECDGDEVTSEDDNSVAMGDIQLCGISDQDFHYPVWCETDCGLVASNVQSDTIFSSDACYKLINRWTVIDWCKWNANDSNRDDENDRNTDSFVAVEDWAQGVCADCPDYGAPIDDPVYFKYTDVQIDGYYTFDQVIKVIDDEAPEITVAEVHNVSTTGGATTKDDDTPCVGAGTIIASATDFCNGSETSANKLVWDIIITVNDQVIDARTARGGSVEINLSELQFSDMIEVEWVVADGCGNSTTTTTMIIPEDDKAPTPFCIGGLTTTLSPDETTITVWASELDFGSFDNCTDAEDLQFAIVYRDDIPILPGEEGFEDQAGMDFDCAELGNIIDLDMWVWDAQGNGDYCSGAINIQGNCDAPVEPPVDTTNVEPPVDTTETNEGSSFIIAGKIMTEYNVPLENTEVRLSANLSEYPKTLFTENNGGYMFGNNPSNVNYNVEAINNDFHENGVTTIDILLIQRHILDLQRLDSPYKIIAADANNDQQVTIADAIDTRSLILGVVDKFPNNTSWTFAKEGQTFPSQINPWPYINTNDIMSLDGSHMNEDMVGIKVGDVNNSATTNNAKAAEKRFADKIDFVLSAPTVQANTIQFKASDISQLYGMQFSMTIPSQEIVGVTSDFISITHQNYHIMDDMITFSWNDTDAIDASEGDILFEVILANKVDGKTLQNIEVHSKVTPIEAYLGASLDIVGIDFIVEDEVNDGFAIYQNTPNPFTDRTEIEFYNPSEDMVKITIFDAEGKMIYEDQSRFTSGHHKLTITSSELTSNGVYYYQIATSEDIQSMKMVRSD